MSQLHSVGIEIHLPGGNSVSGSFSPDNSLQDVLVHFDKEEEQLKEADAGYVKRHFLEYIGIPQVEKLGPKSNGSSLIQIQYNLPGLMLPTMEVFSSPSRPKQIFSAKTHDLTTITVGSLPIFDGRLDMKLYHTYTTNNLTQEEKQDTLTRTVERLKAAGSMGSSTTGSSTTGSSTTGSSTGSSTTSTTSATSTSSSRHPSSTPTSDVQRTQRIKATQTEKQTQGQAQRQTDKAQIVADQEKELPPLPKPRLVVKSTIEPPLPPPPSEQPQSEPAADQPHDDEEKKDDHVDIPNDSSVVTNSTTVSGDVSNTTTAADHEGDEESEVGSEEVTDIDDDRFYEPNKQDYKIIYSMYQRYKEESEQPEDQPQQQQQQQQRSSQSAKGYDRIHTTSQSTPSTRAHTYRIVLPSCYYNFTYQHDEHQEMTSHRLTLSLSIEVQYYPSTPLSTLLDDVHTLFKHPVVIEAWKGSSLTLLPRRSKVNLSQTFAQQRLGNRSAFELSGAAVELDSSVMDYDTFISLLGRPASEESQEAAANAIRNILFL